MDKSIVCPGATSVGRAMRFCPRIKSPLTRTRRYDLVHVQVPLFFNRQTFVNELPGANVDPSGMVTSPINSMRSQPRFGVGVGDWNGVRVGVNVLVGVDVGVKVSVNVGVFVGVFDGVNVNVLVGVRVGVLEGVNV